mgnify:CR=1 FL=1
MTALSLSVATILSPISTTMLTVVLAPMLFLAVVCLGIAVLAR